MRLLLVSCDREVALGYKGVFAARALGELVIAQSAGEALAILGDGGAEFSHVLVDLGLPKASALLVCDAVGRSPRIKQTKLWVIDAGEDEGLVRSAQQLGAQKRVRRDAVPGAAAPQPGGEDAPSAQPQEAPPQTEAAPAPPPAQARAPAPAVAPEPQEEPASSKPLSFEDKTRIPGVRNCVSRSKFDAYFAAMTKAELYKARIVALEITNAEAIFPKVTPDDFLETLRCVALGISDHFAHVPSRLTYNGKGVFFCAFLDQFEFGPDALIASIRQTAAQAEIPVQLILNRLVLNVGPVKRAAGVFTSFPAQQGTQEPAAPGRDPVRPAPAPPSPRRRRVQTRLLKFDA